MLRSTVFKSAVFKNNYLNGYCTQVTIIAITTIGKSWALRFATR